MGSTDARGNSEFGDGRKAMLGLGGAGTGILRGEGDAIRPRRLTDREGRKILGARGCHASKMASKGGESVDYVNTGGIVTAPDVYDRDAPAVSAGGVSMVKMSSILEVT